MSAFDLKQTLHLAEVPISSGSMKPPTISRRMAAFLVGPVVAAPYGIYFSLKHGWVSALIYFALAFAASGYVALTYIGPRYSDPE